MDAMCTPGQGKQNQRGTTMYATYLRAPDQAITDRTLTSDRATALRAFGALLDRTELDGTKMRAVLNFQSIALAHHRFCVEPGNDDHWRGRIDQLPCPAASLLRADSAGGRSITVFLDNASLALAEKLGRGDAGEGLRRSMKKLAGLPGPKVPARPDQDGRPDDGPGAIETCVLAP
jgi:hypothetical protein